MMIEETPKEIQIIEPTKEVVSYSDGNIPFNNMEQLIAYCEPIAKSGISKYTTAVEVASIFLTAKDVGLKPMFALAHVNVIKSIASIDAMGMRALLLTNGITFKINKDYQPVYSYGQTIDGKSYIYTQDDIDAEPTLYQLYPNAGAASKAVALGLIPKDKISLIRQELPTDYVTEIIFTRKIKDVTMVEKGKFLWSEAIQAGLVDKDNWQKMPRNMMFAKAFGRGASRIGADVIGGLYLSTDIDDNYNDATIVID